MIYGTSSLNNAMGYINIFFTFIFILQCGIYGIRKENDDVDVVNGR